MGSRSQGVGRPGHGGGPRRYCRSRRQRGGRGTSGLYEAMASAWWDSLNTAERECWLDSAEADGRDRSMLAAYTLMGDREDLVGVRDEIDFDKSR